MNRQDFITDKRISQSRLKKFAGPDIEFDMEQAIYDLTVPYKETASMNFGKYFHSMLEFNGKADEKEYAIAPIDDGRLKLYKDFAKEETRTIIKPKEHELALKMFARIPNDIRIAIDKGQPEQIFVDEVCKALVDNVYEDCLYEWKTCEGITTKDLRIACNKYGYDIQAYHYLKVSGFKRMKFVFFKTTAPFQIRVYECEPEFIQRGKAKWNEAFDRYMSQEITVNTDSMLWPSEVL